MSLLAFIYSISQPLNHDVAWLLEATRRWVGGATLYRDVVEINPPLIFIEYLVFSGGILTKYALLAGVSFAILISSLWVLRWRGPGLLVSLALTLTGTLDFGQRDHLALIFLVPFLLAPSGLSRRERIALGVWAFLGLGLKPHFLLIPAAFVASQCYLAESFKPVFTAQNWTIGALCLVWPATVALIWPQYFAEIIPLGKAVYSAFGSEISVRSMSLTVLAVTASIVVSYRQESLVPLAAAALGAAAAYLLQGRFWNYHLIPTLGLASIASVMAAHRENGARARIFGIAGLILLIANPLMGPRRYGSAIPTGAKTVLFLSDRVPAAYPSSFECGARNTSRYPTFWTLPAAWNSQLSHLFHKEVANMNEDIRRERPEIIYEDSRLPKFKRSFSFRDWADLSNYRNVGMANRYHVWLRRDLDASILARPPCGDD